MTFGSSSCKTEKSHSGHAAAGLFAQMQENGKRRLWLFALLSFVLLLCYPLMTALRLSSYSGADAGTLIIRQGIGHNMLGLTGGMTVFLLTVGGVLCAVEGFSWIYSRKKIDMYLSQPITAGRRFAFVYINGILIYFIPYLISILLSLLVISGMGAATGALFLNVLFTVPSAFIYFLAVYNLTLLAMMLGGKRGMAGFFIVMGFLYDLLLRSLIESYCSAYFSTYANHTAARQFLSPLGRIMEMLSGTSFAWGSDAVTAGVVAESLIKPLLPQVLVLLLEAALFGALAYICYKKRPMEAASQAVAFPAVKGPVKVLLMVLSGLIGSGAFYDISGNKSAFVAVSGLLIGILFCQAVVEILYEGDLKAFMKHKKSFAAGAAVSVFVYLFFALDISGYDTWVPKQTDVESAAIEIYFGNIYDFGYAEIDGEVIWRGSRYALDEMKMTDVSSVLSLANDGMGKDAGEQNKDTRINCDVKYIMKNGKEKYRNFYIDYEKEKTVLDILFANEDYKNGTNQVLSEQMDAIFERAAAYYDNGMQEKEIVDKNVFPLMRAYQKDVREMSFTDVKDAVPCGTLKLRYRTEDLGEYMLEYPVFPSYTATVEYLRGKNIELYLNLNPAVIDNITVRRYGTEDTEIVEKGGVFGTTVSSLQQYERVREKSYTKKEEIGEILGKIYPSSMTRWVYLPGLMDSDIVISIEEAGGEAAYYYDWNESFEVKKGGLPEFVKEDIGVSP